MLKKMILSFAVVLVAFLAIVAFFIFGGGTAVQNGLVARLPGRNQNATGTLEGEVLLGPTCPVAHIPPLPGCAPRPYATAIAIYQANNTSSPFATLSTDASGTFSLALPGGAYVVTAQSGSTRNLYYPRCSSANIAITAGAVTTTTLSCDSGIR